MSYEYDDIEVGHQGMEVDSHTRLLGTLVHLCGFLGIITTPVISPIAPLVFWIATKENHPFLDDQGKEALNFQISVAIYTVVCLITVIGIPLVLILWLFWVIVPIIAAIKANSGEWYRYPLTIRLVK